MFQATEAIARAIAVPDVGDKVEYDPPSRSESGIDLNSGDDDSDSDEDRDDGRIYFRHHEIKELEREQEREMQLKTEQ